MNKQFMNAKENHSKIQIILDTFRIGFEAIKDEYTDKRKSDLRKNDTKEEDFFFA